MFTTLLGNNDIEKNSEYTTKGIVLAKRIIRTIRNFLGEPVFAKKTNWIDNLTTLTKKYSNTTVSTIKLTPNQASLKKIKEFVHKQIPGKR